MSHSDEDLSNDSTKNSDNINPAKTAADQASSQIKKKPQPFKDWQPLGSVRDSFFEDMKRDR